MLLPLGTLTVAADPTDPLDVATKNYVDNIASDLTNDINNVINNSVWSWNGRRGDVSLLLSDVLGVGGAPINSPAFSGNPTAPNPGSGSNSNAIATTAWVNGAIDDAITELEQNVVLSWNGRQGNVTLALSDVLDVGGAPLYSPDFTGAPTAPTPSPSDVSTRIATTEWVRETIFNTDTGLILELEVAVSTTPPPDPRRGKLWWDLSKGRAGGDLYVWVVDTDSGQWVVANRAEPGPPGRPGLAHDIPNETVLGNISGHEDEPQPITMEELTRRLDPEELAARVDADDLAARLPIFTHDERGQVPPPDYVPNLTRGDYLLCGDGVWRHALFELPNIPEFPSNSAAASGGVPIGGIYHTAGVVHVRLPP
jgi:hypothetical protein